MVVLLTALLVLAALAVFATVLVASQLHTNDAAGNGLAQAWLVVVFAVAWLLTAAAVVAAALRDPPAHAPAELPWRTVAWIAGACLVPAVAAQVVAVAVLCRPGLPADERTLVLACLAAAPLACVLHAAWRGLALPLPTGLATTGLLVVVGVASLVPVGIFVRRQAARAAGPVRGITYPALWLHDELGARVLRGAEHLPALPHDAVESGLVIDANGASWTVWADDNPPSPGPVLPFEDVVARVLALPALHADPTEDAKVRQLVARQRNVTALSFVLPP